MKAGATEGDHITVQLGLIMLWIDLNRSQLKAQTHISANPLQILGKAVGPAGVCSVILLIST